MIGITYCPYIVGGDSLYVKEGVHIVIRIRIGVGAGNLGPLIAIPM